MAFRSARTFRGATAALLCLAVAAVTMAYIALRPRLTVALIGDSLTAESAPYAAALLRHDHFRVRVHAFPGLGLVGGPGDLTRVLETIAAREHDDLVVLEFSGNYVPPYEPGVPPFSDGFFQAWTGRTREVIEVLTQRRMAVDVVLTPPMRSTLLDASAQRVNESYETVLRSTLPRIAGLVGCIRAADAVAGPSGGYVDAIQRGGASVVLRAADGVHFTPAGARAFGEAIASAVERTRLHPSHIC